MNPVLAAALFVAVCAAIRERRNGNEARRLLNGWMQATEDSAWHGRPRRCWARHGRARLGKDMDRQAEAPTRAVEQTRVRATDKEKHT